MFYRLQQRPFTGKIFFLNFALMLLFFRLADSMMSYMVPVVLTQNFGSTFWMGIVMSSSSVVGIIADLIFAKYFAHKRAKFFYKLMMVSAFLFPLSMAIFHHIFGFLFAMAIWGFYYEALGFGNYLFLDEEVGHHDHAWAWGMIALVVNLAFIIGPILGGIVLDTASPFPYLVASIFYLISLILLVFLFFLRKKGRKNSSFENQNFQHTLHQKLAIWKLYFSRVRHLLLLYMMFYFIDASFFSIGPVFAESLKEIHPFGGLFVSMYSIPGLISGVIVMSLAKKISKKKIAFCGGIIAGLGFLFFPLFHNVAVILGLTFFASMGMSLMYPSLGAVIEDLVGRSGHFAKDLIALTSISGSIGYVIAPITNGFLAEQFSPQFVFGFWGVLILGYSCFLLITIRGKTRLPQTALQEVV